MAKSKTAKKSADLVTVVPVAGHFLTGIPAIPHQVDQARADELIATGAFEEGDSDTEIPPEAENMVHLPVQQVPVIEPPAESEDAEDSTEPSDTDDAADTASTPPDEGVTVS